MNWFAHHRQDWIADMLYIYGFINREHITRKFDVSVPQASNDIRRYLLDHPGTVVYNMTAKRYERVTK